MAKAKKDTTEENLYFLQDDEGGRSAVRTKAELDEFLEGSSLPSCDIFLITSLKRVGGTKTVVELDEEFLEAGKPKPTKSRKRKAAPQPEPELPDDDGEDGEGDDESEEPEPEPVEEEEEESEVRAEANGASAIPRRRRRRRQAQAA